MQKKTYRLVFSGGGSGGHLTPSMAIAKEFLKQFPKSDILFIGSDNGNDEKIIKEGGFEFKLIHSGKFRRYFSFKNFIDIIKTFRGIGESIFILKKFKPDIVFSKGGFVSLPVAFAAKFLGIPIITHESDSIHGLANRIISIFAKKVCMTFDIKTDNPKYIHTGTPIREEILNGNKKKGQSFLNFKIKKPIILFMGASQGAEQINNICKTIFPELKIKANIVLLSGKDKKINILNDSFREFEYLSKEFPDVLKAADIVVSRAGANSLFELAALFKASIIIPLSSAANNHQQKNAEIFKNKKAVTVFDPKMDEKKLSRKILKEISELISNINKRSEFEKNIHNMFEKDSSQKIVDCIISLIY